MKAQELRDIAARLNRWADELDGIKTDGGGIKVTLPQPDLFSELERTHLEGDGLTEEQRLRAALPSFSEAHDNLVEAVKEAIPAKRIYQRVGCKMQDEAIVAANKVGRRNGWCQRSDIERSLHRRNPERSREEIREAVNYAVRTGGYMCVKYNSYRFYRTADRGPIIATATAKLCVA